MNDQTPRPDWVLKAMVAMAASDGHLDSREIGHIQSIYQACEGRALTADVIARAADENTTINIREELADAAPALDKAKKEEIVCAAYRVLLADNRIAGEERKKLHDMARALEISEIHLSAILEELSASLENKA